MKQKLRFAVLLMTVLLTLLPIQTALALIVNAPVEVDRGENHTHKIASFSVFNIQLPMLEGSLTSLLNSSLNKLPIVKNETRIGMQAILNSAFLNVRELTGEFTPTPIPTSVLLLSTGLIGLIGIARRSLFTR